MKRTYTIFVVALLMLSFASTFSFVSAQTSGEPFTYVAWEVTETETTFEHSNQNTEWIFGPQPSVWIYYSDNATSIAENSYRVEVGTSIDIEIIIPRQFLGEDVGLDVVRFWGSTGDDGGTFFVLEYNATSDEWSKLNFHYAPLAIAPTESDFIALDTANCVYSDSDDLYIARFRMWFTTQIIRGIFWTGMQAMDTLGRPSTPSWLATLNAGSYAVPPIGLGVDVDSRIFSLPEYYYAEITDLSGNIIHHVNPYEAFVFRIRADKPLSFVELPFAFPFNPEFVIDYNWSMPVSPHLLDTDWVNFTEMPMALTFFYNGTFAGLVAAYLTNITWTWSLEILQWIVDFDLRYEWDFDFDGLVDEPALPSVSHDGAMIEWVCAFTEKMDLNPDPYKNGGKITPDPYFWTVIDSAGTRLGAHPHIRLHNTVSLTFMQEFIEVFLRKDGQIADRALQGDLLDLTVVVHAPEGLVNGTSYIEMNEFGVLTDTGDEIDIGGVYIHTVRHNLTIWFETGGMESNVTHRWRHTTRHFVVVNLRHDMAWSASTVTKWVYNLDGTFAGLEAYVENFVVIHDWNFSIGQWESVLDIQLSFKAETPSMVVQSASIASGGFTWYQLNLSEAGANNWTLYPDEPIIGTNADFFNKILECDIVWSPAHFVLGQVDWFEPQRWTVTPDGAIDLDGNIFTTEDQYFIKRTGYWQDWGNITDRRMQVLIGFDPSPGEDGDEFGSANWMGVIEYEVAFEANETFYWYKADDMSPLSPSEMAEVRAQLWADLEDDVPKPEYKYVAWMTENRTIDLSSVTGLESNRWETTWFYWGTHQAFMVSATEDSRLSAHFTARYAGLLIFKDSPLGPSQSAPDFYFENGQLVTDEVSHLILIDTVGDIQFRRPFGATNNTGEVIVSPETEVSFGVSIYDVEVTIYPLQIEHSGGLRGPWAFRESYDGALGLNATSFDYWITHATVQEMSFDVTFSVDMVEYDPTDPQRWNHAVSFKIDQVFGDFDLHEFDNTVLDEKSLAVNFFATLGTVGRTQYTVGERPVTDTNSMSMSADYYEFGSEQTPFANVTMGGLPYTYGGDGHSTVYVSGSSTVPIGAFSAMYQSTSGQTITDWTVDASMLFMTAGYENWGGHEIICDPVFVAYTSASGTGTTGTFTGVGNEGVLYIAVGGFVALVVTVCALYRRRQ